MNESYVECLVAKKPSSGMKALKVFLIVLAVIFFLLSMLNALMWLGAYFTSLNASVEFEYLYVDKEISIDKILNKTKRKKVEKLETESMEIFAPINSWHLDNMKNRQLKVTDYSSGVAGQPDRRYVMIYSGDRKIIFEPSEAMVKALQSVAPRKVFFD
jgi:cell division protein FtsB